jgi:hypothetical protein
MMGKWCPKHVEILNLNKVIVTWRHLAAKVGTSKGRGKQWQTTPKNLPRMQCARAIPVAWLGSGSCQKPAQRLNTNDDDESDSESEVCIKLGVFIT